MSITLEYLITIADTIDSWRREDIDDDQALEAIAHEIQAHHDNDI